MPIISGKWKWNDELVAPSTDITQNLTDCHYIGPNSIPTVLLIISIRVFTGGMAVDYNDLYGRYNTGSSGTGWGSSSYQTLYFDTENEVSQEFYNYLTANATQQEEPIVPTTTKSVSNKNLTKFKQKCDETYASIGNIPTVSTELVNLGTLSTSGTLTADQVTQIGTTTVGVTARASVNSVTRFYERVNISGTTAMLISADDDALHVLTVNLSTRAYTLSDVALGGGGGPEIPTPTTSDNGKVLGVANGAYALQEAGGGGGGKLYLHNLVLDTSSAGAFYDSVKVSILSERSTAYTDSTLAEDYNSNKLLSTVFHYTDPVQMGEDKVEGFVGFTSTLLVSGGYKLHLYDLYLVIGGVHQDVDFTITSDTVTPL